MSPTVIESVRGRLRRDDGFTLVEVMVAMGIATVILTAFAYASTGTLRALQTARLNQQAADVVTQQIEKIRNMPFGSLGHDPAGTATDPRLTSCSGGRCYRGEPVVSVVGGLNPHISGARLNDFDYTLYTYVTRPADSLDADTKRVTVIAEWAAYGRSFSKTMSTLVTQSQRGLPLPEFKLTPVGPATVTVNPGATAAFGFQLSNQGAPDQWNITSTATDYSIVLDNGDDVYNATEDTGSMVDHNSDGIPDTDRLEPKGSVVFWVIVPVSSSAPDSTATFQVVAQAASQPDVETAAAALDATLIVTTSPVVPTPSDPPAGDLQGDVCPAPGAPAVPAGRAGYTVRSYVLHNSGATSWPQFPLPASDPIPGSPSMSPMYMDMNPVSIPGDRALPSYSTEKQIGLGGRVLDPGASVEFLTQNSNRSYTGDMVLRMWVRPEGSDSATLSAVAFTQRSNGTLAKADRGAAVATDVDASQCTGWHEVGLSLSPGTFSAGNNNVLGVRLRNGGASRLLLAYDHGAYPATFTVVER